MPQVTSPEDKKLLSIIEKMEAAGESEEDIKRIVALYRKKHPKKAPKPAPSIGGGLPPPGGEFQPLDPTRIRITPEAEEPKSELVKAFTRHAQGTQPSVGQLMAEAFTGKPKQRNLPPLSDPEALEEGGLSRIEKPSIGSAEKMSPLEIQQTYEEINTDAWAKHSDDQIIQHIRKWSRGTMENRSSNLKTLGALRQIERRGDVRGISDAELMLYHKMLDGAAMRNPEAFMAPGLDSTALQSLKQAGAATNVIGTIIAGTGKDIIVDPILAAAKPLTTPVSSAFKGFTSLQSGKPRPKGYQSIQEALENASKVTSPAEVHGDVRPQPGKVQGPLPRQGDIKGVQPPAKVSEKEKAVEAALTTAMSDGANRGRTLLRMHGALKRAGFTDEELAPLLQGIERYNNIPRKGFSIGQEGASEFNEVKGEALSNIVLQIKKLKGTKPFGPRGAQGSTVKPPEAAATAAPSTTPPATEHHKNLVSEWALLKTDAPSPPLRIKAFHGSKSSEVTIENLEARKEWGSAWVGGDAIHLTPDRKRARFYATMGSKKSPGNILEGEVSLDRPFVTDHAGFVDQERRILAAQRGFHYNDSGVNSAASTELFKSKYDGIVVVKDRNLPPTPENISEIVVWDAAKYTKETPTPKPAAGTGAKEPGVSPSPPKPKPASEPPIEPAVPKEAAPAATPATATKTPRIAEYEVGDEFVKYEVHPTPTQAEQWATMQKEWDSLRKQATDAVRKAQAEAAHIADRELAQRFALSAGEPFDAPMQALWDKMDALVDTFPKGKEVGRRSSAFPGFEEVGTTPVTPKPAAGPEPKPKASEKTAEALAKAADEYAEFRKTAPKGSMKGRLTRGAVSPPDPTRIMEEARLVGNLVRTWISHQSVSAAELSWDAFAKAVHTLGHVLPKNAPEVFNSIRAQAMRDEGQDLGLLAAGKLEELDKFARTHDFQISRLPAAYRVVNYTEVQRLLESGSIDSMAQTLINNPRALTQNETLAFGYRVRQLQKSINEDMVAVHGWQSRIGAGEKLTDDELLKFNEAMERAAMHIGERDRATTALSYAGSSASYSMEIRKLLIGTRYDAEALATSREALTIATQKRRLTPKEHADAKVFSDGISKAEETLAKAERKVKKTKLEYDLGESAGVLDEARKTGKRGKRRTTTPLEEPPPPKSEPTPWGTDVQVPGYTRRYTRDKLYELKEAAYGKTREGITGIVQATGEQAAYWKHLAGCVLEDWLLLKKKPDFEVLFDEIRKAADDLNMSDENLFDAAQDALAKSQRAFAPGTSAFDDLLVRIGSLDDPKIETIPGSLSATGAPIEAEVFGHGAQWKDLAEWRDTIRNLLEQMREEYIHRPIHRDEMDDLTSDYVTEILVKAEELYRQADLALSPAAGVAPNPKVILQLTQDLRRTANLGRGWSESMARRGAWGVLDDSPPVKIKLSDGSEVEITISAARRKLDEIMARAESWVESGRKARPLEAFNQFMRANMFTNLGGRLQDFTSHVFKAPEFLTAEAGMRAFDRIGSLASKTYRDSVIKNGPAGALFSANRFKEASSIALSQMVPKLRDFWIFGQHAPFLRKDPRGILRKWDIRMPHKTGIDPIDRYTSGMSKLVSSFDITPHDFVRQYVADPLAQHFAEQDAKAIAFRSNFEKREYIARRVQEYLTGDSLAHEETRTAIRAAANEVADGFVYGNDNVYSVFAGLGKRGVEAKYGLHARDAVETVEVLTMPFIRIFANMAMHTARVSGLGFPEALGRIVHQQFVPKTQRWALRDRRAIGNAISLGFVGMAARMSGEAYVRNDLLGSGFLEPEIDPENGIIYWPAPHGVLLESIPGASAMFMQGMAEAFIDKQLKEGRISELTAEKARAKYTSLTSRMTLPFTNQPLYTGPRELVEIARDTESGSLEKLGEFGARSAGRAVPFSGLLRDTSRRADELKNRKGREVHGFLDGLKAQAPILRQQLPRKGSGGFLGAAGDEFVRISYAPQDPPRERDLGENEEQYKSRIKGMREDMEAAALRTMESPWYQKWGQEGKVEQQRDMMIERMKNVRARHRFRKPRPNVNLRFQG